MCGCFSTCEKSKRLREMGPFTNGCYCREFFFLNRAKLVKIILVTFVDEKLWTKINMRPKIIDAID